MKSRLLGLLAAGVLFGSTAAQAVVIDFDDLGAVPVALSNQYSAFGVTFSATEDGSPVDALAGVSLTGTWHTSPYVWSNCTDSICGPRADVLRIDFASPVGNLEWYTDTAGAESPTFYAYDLGGTLLETVVATATTEGTYNLTSFTATGISYVELLQPNDEWGYYIDTLSFSVPAPATLALLGIGLAGLGIARRRRAQ